MKEDDYIGGIKKETYDLLFKDENLPELNEEEAQKGKENDKILDVIASFTTLDDKRIKGNILKKIYEKRFGIDFSKISYNEKDKKYEYSLGDRQYHFEKLSDVVEDKKTKKELLSNKRYKKCHQKAIELIDCFRNPACILSGIYIKNGKRYLHSVIELQGKKDVYIVDYTLNVIMPKKCYVELTQFEEIERIKDTEVLQDMKDGDFKLFTDMGFRIKTYVNFRKELKVDLEKNRKMIQTEDDEQLNKSIETVKKQREEFEKE